MQFKFMTYLNYYLNIGLIRLFLLLVLFIFMSISSLNIYIDSKLPDEERIRDIELQIPLKIYTSDSKLIGEFGEKRRSSLSYEEIPEFFVKAVLAAEDDDFFSHSGVSYTALFSEGSDYLAASFGEHLSTPPSKQPADLRNPRIPDKGNPVWAVFSRAVQGQY